MRVCSVGCLAVALLALGCSTAPEAGTGVQENEVRMACATKAAEFNEWGQKYLAGEVGRPEAPLSGVIDQTLARTDLEEGTKISMALFEVFGACQARVVRDLEPISYARGADKPRLMIAGVTSTIANCACTGIDVANVEALTYQLWKR
jgi:hypothetical protein